MDHFDPYTAPARARTAPARLSRDSVRHAAGAYASTPSAISVFTARRLATSVRTMNPALAGRLDPAHTEIYEKLAADIAHRRAIAGLQET